VVWQAGSRGLPGPEGSATQNRSKRQRRVQSSRQGEEGAFKAAAQAAFYRCQRATATAGRDEEVRQADARLRQSHQHQSWAGR